MEKINLNNKNELNEAIVRLESLKNRATSKRTKNVISDRITTYKCFLQDLETPNLLKNKMNGEFTEDE